MKSTISVSALLVVLSVALAPPVAPPVTGALPQAALAHPAGETETAPPTALMPPRWLPRALSAWGGPQPPREGLYDERYITW